MEIQVIDNQHLQKQLKEIIEKQCDLKREFEIVNLDRQMEIYKELTDLAYKEVSLHNRIKSSSLPKVRCTKEIMI